MLADLAGARSEFDQMLLDNAREHGVDAYDGASNLRLAGAVRNSDDRATGVAIKQDGQRREIKAKVVVDASGQAAMLMNRMKLRVWDPVLNKGAIWTYWEGAYRDTGRDEGATMVLQTPGRDGWFWEYPQHDNIVSLGVVAPFDYLFKGRKGDHEADLLRRGREDAGGEETHRQREAGHGFFATRDYSYRSTEAAGNGWVLV